MEQFFQSVGRSFAENRSYAPAAEKVLLACALLAVLGELLFLAWRWRSYSSRFSSLAFQRGLGEPEQRLLRELARLVEQEPTALLTHLDQFERATGLLLARAGGQARRGDPFAQVRQLRHALGFDRLPAHTPLFTSRELPPGTAVDLEGLSGQTSAVTEASFTVLLRAHLRPEPGRTVELELAHAREARYLMSCKLLSVEAIREGQWRLQFAHDEAPRRIQERDHVRTPASGPVALRPVGPWLMRPAVNGPVAGQLVDASAGGLRVLCRPQLPPGQLVTASFALGGQQFDEVRAVVLGSERNAQGSCEVQLGFRGLAEAESEKLVVAVDQLLRAQRARPS
jgi:hypothetical protein